MTHGLDAGVLVATEFPDHPAHDTARISIERMLTASDKFALAPQVLTEFIHVVTDNRRFTTPISMQSARHTTWLWWNSDDVIQVMPTHDAVNLFLRWHEEHVLGRKRLLDTLLAATYWAAGVESLLTTNAVDFRVFGVFKLVDFEA